MIVLRSPKGCAISAFESRSKPFQIHNSRSGALTARPFRGVTGVTGGEFRSGELLQRPQATPQILGNAGKSIKTIKGKEVFISRSSPLWRGDIVDLC